MKGLSAYRVFQIIVPRLCGCCRGAVDPIMSSFTQLHRPTFILESELESIGQVVVDLSQRKGKINGCFKNSTRQYQNKVSFPRKGSGIVLKVSLHF